MEFAATTGAKPSFAGNVIDGSGNRQKDSEMGRWTLCSIDPFLACFSAPENLAEGY